MANRQGHMVRGNPAFNLVSSLKQDAAQMVNEVSASALNTDVRLDDCPNHLTVTLLWITSIFPDEDNDNELHARARQEIGDIFDGDDQNALLLRCLFRMVRSTRTGLNTSLMISMSMMRIVSESFENSLNLIFDACGTRHATTSLYEFLIAYPELADCNPYDLGPLTEAQPQHIVFGFSLIMTLMGKSLNNNNYLAWMLSRNRSFALPLGLKENDPLCGHLKPTSQFSQCFYTEVKANWRVRRLFFLYIWALSKREDLLGQGCQVTVSLLRFSEMTNVAMILLWIGTLNHVLLGWHELGKHLPHLCAAYAKYKAIGAMAPWAKLILPQQEVTEFASEKLRVLFTVARELATVYGSATARQIEGGTKTQVMTSIIEQALKIVSVSGGARRIDTMAVRSWSLNGYQNSALHQELDTGAMNIVNVGADEIAPALENRMGLPDH